VQSKVLKNDYYSATALKNMGWIRFKTDKSFNSIISDYQQAVAIAEEIQEKRLLLSCYDNLGDLYFSCKDFVNSLQYFNKMLYISDDIEYVHMTIRALKNIGNVHRELGDIKAAESFLNHAMNLAREKNILEMLRDCSYDKALLHEIKRDFKAAFQNFKHYHHYALKIENEKSARQMAGVLQVEESSSSKDINESMQIPDIIGQTEEFRNRLLIDYPKLTPRQVEIAGLLHNGMSSKEISILLNIEVDSINKQRARIRKTLDISRTQNLMTFLKRV
jgi:DNA-binding CsgD family transcriptional regulator